MFFLILKYHKQYFELIFFIILGFPLQAPTFESHFIDVGTITFGGIFGLGEKMEHRVVMARSTVQCLILPRFFLLEKKQNPGNIWERRLKNNLK